MPVDEQGIIHRPNPRQAALEESLHRPPTPAPRPAPAPVTQGAPLTVDQLGLTFSVLVAVVTGLLLGSLTHWLLGLAGGVGAYVGLLKLQEKDPKKFILNSLMTTATLVGFSTAAATVWWAGIIAGLITVGMLMWGANSLCGVAFD